MAGRNFTDSEEEQIVKIYLSGKSTRAIAKAYGLRFHISICDALRRQGVQQRPAPERNRLYKLNPNMFDKIDNEGAAYWYGFLYADGSISRRSLNIALQPKDYDHLQKLKEFMQSESPISITHSTLGEKTYQGVRISFTDRHLISKLTDLGIVAYRPYPERIKTFVPDEFLNHWLRGFFDGDGCACKIQFVSFVGSFRLIEWIRNILAINANINPLLRLRPHTKSNVRYLTISGRLQALKVADYLYKNATIFMDRKKDLIDSWR